MSLEINLPEPLREWQASILGELRDLEDALPDLEAALLAAEEAAAAARDLVIGIERLVGSETPVAIAGRIALLRRDLAVAEQQAVQARHERERHQKTIADRSAALAVLDAARDRHAAAIGASAPRSGEVVRMGSR